MKTTVHSTTALLQTLCGFILAGLFFTLSLLPQQALAITINQCAPQYNAYLEAANVYYAGEVPEDLSSDILSTGPINMDFINTLGFEDAAGNLQAMQELPANTDEDMDWQQFSQAKTAVIICMYEQRLAELGNTSESTDMADYSDDISSDSDAEQNALSDSSGDSSDTSGQNKGKGGNPDYMYDDDDHGHCVTVEPVGNNTGSQMAYGHYKLINTCNYPIKILKCITPDSADGSESPNFELHKDGLKCPGMGWLAGDLEANEVELGREWFEYNRLKWDLMVCRAGWDFVAENDRYPSGILGETYGCKTRRP
jgi:hypothetical protein